MPKEGVIRPVLVRDERDNVSLLYLYSSVFWLVVSLAVRVLVTVTALNPWIMRGTPLYAILTYGRLQPVYVQTLAFGWLSMAMIGLALYFVPRLARRPLRAVPFARAAAWLKNVAVAAGAGSVLVGISTGREFAEWIWPINVIWLLGFLAAGYALFETLRDREPGELDVPLWHVIAAFIWMAILFFVGNAMWSPSGGATGLADALLTWFYGHSLIGLWLGMMALGIVYYLVPRLADRTIYDQKLATLGFWGLAALYPASGAYLMADPVPDSLQRSALVLGLLLIIPMWAVLTNVFRTMEGRWSEVRARGPEGRFLTVGFVFLAVYWFQGVFQLIPAVNETVQFTLFTAAHEQLALLGALTFIAAAGIYYVVPRMAGQSWYSESLIGFHFWVSLVGIVLLYFALVFAGLNQGAGWAAGVPFENVLAGIRPQLAVQAWATLLLLGAQVAFAYNTLKTGGAPGHRTVGAPRASDYGRQTT